MSAFTDASPAVALMRAAVAEAGYDPALILEPDPGDVFAVMVGDLPEEVIWQAVQVTRVQDPICWACTVKARAEADAAWAARVLGERFDHIAMPDCTATTYFTENCRG